MDVTTQITRLREDFARMKSRLVQYLQPTSDSTNTQPAKTSRGSRHAPRENRTHNEFLQQLLTEVEGLSTRLEGIADEVASKSSSGRHDRENEAALPPQEAHQPPCLTDETRVQLSANSGIAPSPMDLDAPTLASEPAELPDPQEPDPSDHLADEPQAQSPADSAHEQAKSREPENETALACEPDELQGGPPATSQPPLDTSPADLTILLEESDGDTVHTETAASSTTTPSTDATTVGEELAATDDSPPMPTTGPDIRWSVPTVETPSVQDWQEYLSFYNRVSISYESAGFVLIEVPPSLMEPSQSQPQVEISTSSRGNIRWLDEYVAQIRPEKVDHDPPVTWEITSQPAGPQDPCSAFNEWWRKFGPQSSNHTLPLYADNVNLDDARVEFGLPEKSPIYPLDGNVLLESAPEAGGLTIPEGFFSQGFGTVFTLHTEDFDMPALNVNYSGCPTCWVCISKSETRKLLAALERDGLAVPTRRSCHQYPRHENLFLHPAYLEKNEIQYSCFLQQPGIGVLVLDGAAHYGFNLGSKRAEADNYVPRGWQPPHVKECNCYEWPPIRREMLLLKSASTGQTSNAAISKKRKKTPASQKSKRQMTEEDIPRQPSNDAPVAEWITYIGKFELLRPPREVKDSPLCRYILALWSRERIVQMCRAMKLWGEASSIRKLCSRWRTGSEVEQIKNIEKCTQLVDSHGHLSSVISRIFQVYQSRKIWEQYRQGDQLKYNALYSAFDIAENDKANYSKRYDKYRMARKLDSLCGDYGLGLLFLIPYQREAPYHVSSKDYARDILADQVPDFHRLLGMSELFSAACAEAGEYAQCILDGKDIALRTWELGTDIEALYSMRDEVLLEQLKKA